MIEEIEIRDLGVIASGTLPLGPGFTAVTGETGAGKTMVVTALGLLLGQRSDSGVVRAGQKQTSVQGRWLVPAEGAVADRVREAGGDLDEAGEAAELLLGRIVTAEGRGRAIVGGRTAPIGILSELGEQLVVVHGQSDQIRLRAAPAQRDALDRFAGEPLHQALADYQERYRRLIELRTELETLTGERDARLLEAEQLRAALAEIEQADPQPGEDTELAERADRLTNLEELRLSAAGARELVSAEAGEESDVVGLLEGARRQLDRAAVHDPALGAIAASVANASYLAAEIAAELSSYLAGLDEDGARELEVVQERRATLATLARKYGPTADDVLQLLETGSTRLLELDGDSDRITQLEGEVERLVGEVDTAAAALSAVRVEAAARLGAAASTELRSLAMAEAELVVEVTDRDDLTVHGKDAIAFLLRPHAGAEPRPLGKGASGGELSRVMLALEVVIAGADPVPTFVFDEVDAGVGGAAAIEIGRRLAALAERSQVIVVTHLAQVAAFANNHLSVVKGGDGSVTASSVRQLVGADREAEMARLLSGLAESDSGLAHARELLALAAS
ncbi:DNA repair protein RecN [Plantibacter sp. Leaf171]|uniref:DNA repair protein RecN n=1 Tax=unclassified Plantibacter TaxID=2624265 RepID=UPI000700CC0D|nr:MULTISPECIES: DNA repair protein RecN [unclassified Plantibacter]KQM14878.1 DNA repair protein RecN [Plantibacter sp. Leaf1]KQR58021.1 DNA repair protein RecN [Plantibacter sp. Leaf171]